MKLFLGLGSRFILDNAYMLFCPLDNMVHTNETGTRSSELNAFWGEDIYSVGMVQNQSKGECDLAKCCFAYRLILRLTFVGSLDGLE